MQSEFASLPIQVQPLDHESGLGFLLRAFSANGASLAQAKQEFSIRDWRSLTPAHVRILAHTTHSEPDWLAERLMLRSTQTPDQFLFFGHPFRCLTAAPNMGAKVCPVCIRKDRCCHRVWVLPGAVACPVHDRPLIDTCGRCQRLITWRRPAIDVCSCGRYLTDGANGDERLNRSYIKTWTRWLDARLDQHEPSQGLNDIEIPRLLSCMSIDGATALVLAFGIIDNPEQSISPRIQRRQPISFMSGSIQRGIERLRSIDGAPQDARLWSAHIYTPTLERLRRNGVTASDRDCAALFLSYASNRSHRSKGGRYCLGQLELFN